MLHAQGILTVTPGRTATVAAGTGTIGYTGDGGAATSATLASPSAVAYDAAGNLYLADALNHVVREITASGQITTFAGTGLEGYGGDGGAATLAYLDTPTGVAVDSSGNIYIADSHNHRIREVSGGTITTLAGTGVLGFSGDGSAATAAQLSRPMGVAVDSNGNIYIADTGNQRIRKITGTTITTIAGDGEQFFSGDGAAATAAVLDSPTAIAVDLSGNIYIADRHNQRIRMISGTTITTIAGSGAASFSGSFSGDNASATSSTLSRPSGVSVDPTGNIYIADTGNQRIRQLGGGIIATLVGSGQQGFGVDGATPATLNLSTPRAVASDSLGNLAIADTLNQRLRATKLPTLTYAVTGVGILSPTQVVTLANTGSAAITIASVNINGAFAATPGTCTAIPITLAANATCTETVAFLPTTLGAATGSVVVAGTGLVPQSILLTGTAGQTATTTTLVSSVVAPLVGQAVTFTATVKPTGIGSPAGTVSFYDGTSLVGTAQTLVAGSAAVSTTTLVAGANNITAVYSGSTSFITSTSALLVEPAIDFNFTAGSGSSASETVQAGSAVTYAINLLPLGGAFPLLVTFSATGLPPGATATFSPTSLLLGANPGSFAVTIQTAARSGMLQQRNLLGGGTIALGLLLLPFSRRLRQRSRGLRALPLCAALLLSLTAISGLAGCASNSNLPTQAAQTYTINLFATATATGGAVLQHSTPITLTVQ